MGKMTQWFIMMGLSHSKHIKYTIQLFEYVMGTM